VKFKLDENIPFILKRVIEALGNHVVDSVFHENITGICDQNLNSKCYLEKQVLFTLDTDFINISDPFYGIIVLRPKTQGKNAVKSLFEIFLKNYPIEKSLGKILIIEPSQIRIR
jgi:predicted nuclease of predicted toxin-antitoxin system